MNLTLKVTKKENANMSSLIKQMCFFKSRISVDSIKGNILIVDMDESNVGSIIDAISEAFEITSIYIIPTGVLLESDIDKVKFNNEEVQEQLNKFLKNIYGVMKFNKASTREICQYLMSANIEFTMKYNPKIPIKLAVGDIVDCNYGSHLKGEVSGGHIHSVICDIDENGMIYAVPITKAKFEGDETRFLQFIENTDVKYNDDRFTGGTVLLKMGRYIHPLRITGVVGHALPKFLHKILIALPKTVDFSSKYNCYEEEPTEKSKDAQKDDTMLAVESTEKSNSEEDRKDTTKESTTDEISKIPMKENDMVKKVSVEEYVANVIADALNSLDNSKSIEEQVDNFLDAIGMPKSSKILRSSFIAVYDVKKVNYESIICKIQSELPKIRGEIIKITLKDEFKKWLNKHPEITEKYPRISIIVLFKLFAKKIK